MYKVLCTEYDVYDTSCTMYIVPTPQHQTNLSKGHGTRVDIQHGGVIQLEVPCMCGGRQGGTMRKCTSRSPAVT